MTPEDYTEYFAQSKREDTSEKTEWGALGRICTRAEVCPHLHGAHMAYEPTHIVAG